jgi:NurA-like 5'-3' nuclease
MIEKLTRIINNITGIRKNEEILKELREINRNISKIADCVQDNRRPHGDRKSISIKHWND